jgi:hypothetical protein
MHKGDSAKMITSMVQSSLVFIEPALETCILISNETREESMYETDEVKSKSAQFSSFLRTRNVKSIGTVDVPSSARMQIENILTGSGLDRVVGLEEDILNCANKYLYDQLIYSREIDEDRLSTRLSSFSSEMDVLSYISLYSNDLVAVEMDTLQFMLTDRASTKPLYHLQQELSLLQSTKTSLNQTKLDILQSQQVAGENWNESLLRSSQSTMSSADGLEIDSINRFGTNEEYLGFVQTGPDLYAKSANPHFLCNEKTVSSYSVFMSHQ